MRNANGPKREYRTFNCHEFRLLEDDGQPPKIRGHAAVFNQASEDLGYYKELREIILPGAFAKAVGRDDVRALWNHNSDWVLGRSHAKPTPTLRMQEDSIGLLTETDPPDTAWARDHLVTIRRGDVSQMSFAFTSVGEHFKKVEGVLHRYIEEVKLYDISPVTYPAYPQTSVGVRAAGELEASLEEIMRRGELALSDPDAWKLQHERRRRQIEALSIG